MPKEVKVRLVDTNGSLLLRTAFLTGGLNSKTYVVPFVTGEHPFVRIDFEGVTQSIEDMLLVPNGGDIVICLDSADSPPEILKGKP